MVYLLALFCPPLALILALRPISAVFNAILYGLAWLGLLFFFVPGVLAWLCAVVHAFAVISSAHADRTVRRVVQAQRAARVSLGPASTAAISVEPTDAMIAAGVAVLNRRARLSASDSDTACAVYEAMNRAR